jgi:TRAP-type C4-dicarboxylate transport system permease large subunit
VTDTLDGVIVLVVIFLLIAGFVIDLLIIILTPDLPTPYPELNGDPVRFGMVFTILRRSEIHASRGRGYVRRLLDPALSDR